MFLKTYSVNFRANDQNGISIFILNSDFLGWVDAIENYLDNMITHKLRKVFYMGPKAANRCHSPLLETTIK